MSQVLHALAHAAHVLPAQGPLEVFIHHNTLHAYEALPFHEAIAQAEGQLGVTGYLPEAEYRAAFSVGRIEPSDVEWALDRFLPEAPADLPVDFRALARALLQTAPGPMPRHTLEVLKAEGRWAARLDERLSPDVKQRLIAQTVQWLDEGLRSGEPLRSFTRRLVGPRVDAVSGGLVARGVNPAEAERAAIARVLQPLDVEPTLAGLREALSTRAEALTAFALWGACVEIAGGGEVLAEAPGDAVELETARLANELLIPLCASFVDRGVAAWQLPKREDGFFLTALRSFAAPGVMPAWARGLPDEAKALLAAKTTALEVLDRVPAEDRAARFERHLLRLPGWAGMFQRLEQFPVPELPAVRLADFLAVRLLVDGAAQAAAERSGREIDALRPVLVSEVVLALNAALPRLGLSAREVSQLGAPAREALVEAVTRLDRRRRSIVWQEAYERHHAVEVVSALLAHQEARRQTPPPTVQAVFCIDDREEAYRRHFEEVLPSVRTYGIAGFFGIAVEFLPLDDVASATQAPLGVTPAHAVHEQPHPEDVALAQARKSRLGLLARFDVWWRRATKGSAAGGVASLVAGPLALLELGARVLAPRLTQQLLDRARAAVVPEVRTVLTRERELDEPIKTIDGRFVGFTFDEKAARVAATLENLGLVKDFAPLVVIVAHGSSSVNNPHRSAYDCGACGGRNGGPNARLFARMANRPAVREALAARGIVIPPTTHFLGAVHDTSTEAMAFFDEHEVPAALAGELASLKLSFDEVSRRSAHERCRKFASAPKTPSLERALRHVQSRSLDFSQARPELGHATNAVAVVGRRALTRGLFLDRRAFLISYDPTLDPDGAILERIVAAAAPVGAGINLEYYFSRVDNERLGCGTKLPHNLVSHVGVMNGASSDLRTGLPKQMIEIHEPVRLLFVLETEPAVVEAMVARQPPLRALALNGWVRVVTVSPTTRACFALGPKGFEPWDGRPTRLPNVRSSRAWYDGHEGFRPPAAVLSEGAADVA